MAEHRSWESWPDVFCSVRVEVRHDRSVNEEKMDVLRDWLLDPLTPGFWRGYQDTELNGTILWYFFFSDPNTALDFKMRFA